MQEAGGREQWIIERAEKGRPGGPHTAPTGHWEQTQALGGEAGSFGMQDAFSCLTQESDTHTPLNPNIIPLPRGGGGLKRSP